MGDFAETQHSSMSTNIITVKFTDQTLRHIDYDGMDFVDDSGQLHHVEFKVCRKNWVVWANANLERKQEIPEDFNCIGNRDAWGQPTYIEIFSAPHVRFEFISKWHQRIFKHHAIPQNYHHLRNKIFQLGLSTFDMA
jgi:hypothetical protein